MEQETAAAAAASAQAPRAGLPPPHGVFEQVLGYIQSGGPVMILLAAISVLALTIVIAKLLQFARMRLTTKAFVDQALDLWRSGQTARALMLLDRQVNPVARVLEVALYGTEEGAPEGTVKEEVDRVAASHLDSLRAGLREMGLIATLSPLIGLLGTVLGMIQAFQAMEQAGSRIDPSILSGGIWVALLTTAAGLIIAIPAAAAHNWMEGVVDRSRRTMEDAATQVFTVALEYRRSRAAEHPPLEAATRPAQ
jgi:biopolymer transport protein ExbB